MGTRHTDRARPCCWDDLHSQGAFIDSTLSRFNIADATHVTTPLASGTHPSVADCPSSQDENNEMSDRPYIEPSGTLVWLPLGTHPGIAFILFYFIRHELACSLRPQLGLRSLRSGETVAASS